MARNESDREDLMAEAVALRNRIEWQHPDEPEPVVAGVKRDGSLSLYFGADPVYQFNPAGELRRAFVADRLYRTQGVTLARFERLRTADQTILERTDLTPDALQRLLSDMLVRLQRLKAGIVEGRATVLRQVASEDQSASGVDFVALIEAALERRALAPPLATRRH